MKAGDGVRPTTTVSGFTSANTSRIMRGRFNSKKSGCLEPSKTRESNNPIDNDTVLIELGRRGLIALRLVAGRPSAQELSTRPTLSSFALGLRSWILALRP